MKFLKYLLLLIPFNILALSVPNNITLFLNNTNLSYNGSDLSHYYLLQDSGDLFNWNNLYVFYNQTNYPIINNKNKDFFRISIYDATKVGLSWANTNLNAPIINVYYGLNSRAYTISKSFINTNFGIISNLTPNITYYFAATSSDTNGNESDFSSEIEFNKDSLLILGK